MRKNECEDTKQLGRTKITKKNQRETQNEKEIYIINK